MSRGTNLSLDKYFRLSVKPIFYFVSWNKKARFVLLVIKNLRVRMKNEKGERNAPV
jgi:hypothetical protein